MTNAFVKLAALCGQGGGCAGLLTGQDRGDTGEFAHLPVSPSAERGVRQQSQHLASAEEAGLRPAAGSCLMMLPGRVKLAEKNTGRQGGIWAKISIKALGQDSCYRYQRCQQVL